MALTLQQAHLGGQGVEVAGCNLQRPLQGRGCLGVVVFVQVQARQVYLGVGILGLLLERLLVLFQGCLQRAEIQADGIGIEAQ
ncbi:hypothetical protein D3C81_1637280 [compost metagenome]